MFPRSIKLFRSFPWGRLSVILAVVTLGLSHPSFTILTENEDYFPSEHRPWRREFTTGTINIWILLRLYWIFWELLTNLQKWMEFPFSVPTDLSGIKYVLSGMKNIHTIL